MSRKTIYLLAAILGTLLPWLFFANFFQQHGANLLLFARSLFVNGAAGGFSLDVLLSIAIFLFWSWHDAQQKKIQSWWLLLPATCLVGLSLSLPLYLYLREDKAQS